jgi:hypothetical protein
MCFALDGGVWLHRHRINEEPMAHLVSVNRERLLALGRELGLRPGWLLPDRHINSPNSRAPVQSPIP